MARQPKYERAGDNPANCLDRHLEARADQTAIIWEGDDPADDAHITYRDLHERVRPRPAQCASSVGVSCHAGEIRRNRPLTDTYAVSTVIH